MTSISSTGFLTSLMHTSPRPQIQTINPVPTNLKRPLPKSRVHESNPLQQLNQLLIPRIRVRGNFIKPFFRKQIAGYCEQCFLRKPLAPVLSAKEQSDLAVLPHADFCRSRGRLGDE